MVERAELFGNGTTPPGQLHRAGDLLFCAGQLPIDRHTGAIPLGIKAQVQQAIENVADVLASANADLSSVVKLTIYLEDLNDLTTVNNVFSTFFAENPPARTTVEVARLRRDALVEIEAVAHVRPIDMTCEDTVRKPAERTCPDTSLTGALHGRRRDKQHAAPHRMCGSSLDQGDRERDRAAQGVGASVGDAAAGEPVARWNEIPNAEH